MTFVHVHTLPGDCESVSWSEGPQRFTHMQSTFSVFVHFVLADHIDSLFIELDGREQRIEQTWKPQVHVLTTQGQQVFPTVWPLPNQTAVAQHPPMAGHGRL